MFSPVNLTWQIGDLLIKHKASDIVRSQPKLSIGFGHPRSHACLKHVSTCHERADN